MLIVTNDRLPENTVGSSTEQQRNPNHEYLEKSIVDSDDKFHEINLNRAFCHSFCNLQLGYMAVCFVFLV